MGIQNFSKIFAGKEVKYTNLKNLTVAVDASVIAYQSALGMKNINALTDSNGNPTIHINVVIAKCLNFKKYSMEQAWVFDFHEKGYTNPSKILETEKRKKIREKAQKKIMELQEKKASIKISDIQESKDELFSSDEDEEETKENINEKIHSQERAGFSMTDTIVNDIKFILDCFNIKWCESPKNYEAEAICAMLTDDELDGACCDLVWTTDTDAIIYGAKQIVRELKIKQKKKLMLYDLDSILNDNDINMDDLRKIAVISGCDHCDKTPKIGPKTVLKKFKNIELTEEQEKSMDVFKKTYNISKLNWHNENEDEFDDSKKIKNLLDWLESKNFNRERIKKQIDKSLN